MGARRRRRTRRRRRAAAPWPGRPARRRRGRPGSRARPRRPRGRSSSPPAREHVGGDAGLGEGGHQLAHVDVHAAAVALPGWASGDVCRERTASRRMMGTAGGQRSASPSSSSSGPSAALVLVAERVVDADQGLLLLLGEVRIAADLAHQIGALPLLEDARPARRASRRRSRGPGRSAGGSRRTASAGPARSGSGTGSRSPPSRTACAARGDRRGAARG